MEVIELLKMEVIDWCQFSTKSKIINAINNDKYEGGDDLGTSRTGMRKLVHVSVATNTHKNELTRVFDTFFFNFSLSPIQPVCRPTLSLNPLLVETPVLH